jgi:hypothetical protein
VDAPSVINIAKFGPAGTGIVTGVNRSMFSLGRCPRRREARQIVAEIARVTVCRSAVFAGPVENMKIQI